MNRKTYVALVPYNRGWFGGSLSARFNQVIDLENANRDEPCNIIYFEENKKNIVMSLGYLLIGIFTLGFLIPTPGYIAIFERATK